MSARNQKFNSSKRTMGVSRPASTSKPFRKSLRKQAPVAKALRPYTTSAPSLVSSGNQIRVSHREFVQDVSITTTFTATSFAVNPGRDLLFTWLPDLATRYERYQFEKLCFKYEPRCSTATAGSVILAMDFDPLDPAPATKQDVYAYHNSAQSSPWDECSLTVESGVLANRGTLFTRAGTIPAGADLKSYDLGNLWLCTSGGADVAGGELFVEYTVVLKIPQVSSNVQSASYTPTAGVTAAKYLGTAPLTVTGLLDISITQVGGVDTFRFEQDWKGLVSYVINGTGLVSPMTDGLGGSFTSVAGVSDGTGVQAIGSGTLNVGRGGYFQPALTAVTTVTGTSWTFTPTL